MLTDRPAIVRVADLALGDALTAYDTLPDPVDTDPVDTDDSDTVDTETDAPVMFDLTLNGTGFDPHDGQILAVAIHDLDGFALSGGGMTTVAAGSFSIMVADKLEAGAEYAVDYFADMNGNKKCDADDHAWHLEIPAVAGDVVLDEIHDPAAVDLMACKAF